MGHDVGGHLELLARELLAALLVGDVVQRGAEGERVEHGSDHGLLTLGAALLEDLVVDVEIGHAKREL